MDTWMFDNKALSVSCVQLRSRLDLWRHVHEWEGGLKRKAHLNRHEDPLPVYNDTE